MSKRPTITVITPTFGRSTIIDAVGNVIPKLLPGDEYIVVGDGEVPIAREVCAMFPRVTYTEIPVHVGDFGCTPCDHAIAMAKGDFLQFLGDDNYLSELSLQIVREGVLQRPDLPHMFAMMHTGNYMAGSRECGHCDAHQFVVPNVPGLPLMKDVDRARWNISDWVWMDKVIKHFGGIIYHPEVIAILPQQNNGALI